MFVFGFALSPPQGYRASSVSSVAFPLLAPDGTAAAPSYAFSSDIDTGWFWSATQANLSVGGTTRVSVSTTTTRLLGGTGGIDITGVAISPTSNATLTINAFNNGLLITKSIAGTGANGRTLVVTSAADTALTASTEINAVNYVLSATREWATGALTLHREFYVQAPTIAFVGASTCTDAVTFAVSGPPIAGANATLTRSWIATFGTLEATAFTPVAGIGHFNAGAVTHVWRDTTGNAEAFVYILAADGLIFGTATSHTLVLRTNNENRLTISADGTSWTVAYATLFSLPSACNLTVGAAAIASGTNQVQVLTGTAPSSQTADTVSLYSSDIAAGHTEPSFYCEGTQVLATGQADIASSVRVKMRINGTEVTLLAV